MKIVCCLYLFLLVFMFWLFFADGRTRTVTALRHYHLKVACLPIPPRRHVHMKVLPSCWDLTWQSRSRGLL
jgi:hypothetical protein